jgi:hypothetical protein
VIRRGKAKFLMGHKTGGNRCRHREVFMVEQIVPEAQEYNFARKAHLVFGIDFYR